MPIELTPEEIALLEELAAAGQDGPTISGARRRDGLARLVEVGFVTDQAASMDSVLYLITDRGREALNHAK